MASAQIPVMYHESLPDFLQFWSEQRSSVETALQTPSADNAQAYLTAYKESDPILKSFVLNPTRETLVSLQIQVESLLSKLEGSNVPGAALLNTHVAKFGLERVAGPVLDFIGGSKPLFRSAAATVAHGEEQGAEIHAARDTLVGAPGDMAGGAGGGLGSEEPAVLGDAADELPEIGELEEMAKLSGVEPNALERSMKKAKELAEKKNLSPAKGAGVGSQTSSVTPTNFSDPVRPIAGDLFGSSNNDIKEEGVAGLQPTVPVSPPPGAPVVLNGGDKAEAAGSRKVYSLTDAAEAEAEAAELAGAEDGEDGEDEEDGEDGVLSETAALRARRRKMSVGSATISALVEDDMGWGLPRPAPVSTPAQDVTTVTTKAAAPLLEVREDGGESESGESKPPTPPSTPRFPVPNTQAQPQPQPPARAPKAGFFQRLLSGRNQEATTVKEVEDSKPVAEEPGVEVALDETAGTSGSNAVEKEGAGNAMVMAPPGLEMAHVSLVEEEKSVEVGEKGGLVGGSGGSDEKVLEEQGRDREPSVVGRGVEIATLGAVSAGDVYGGMQLVGLGEDREGQPQHVPAAVAETRDLTKSDNEAEPLQVEDLSEKAESSTEAQQGSVGSVAEGVAKSSAEAEKEVAGEANPKPSFLRKALETATFGALPAAAVLGGTGAASEKEEAVKEGKGPAEENGGEAKGVIAGAEMDFPAIDVSKEQSSKESLLAETQEALKEVGSYSITTPRGSVRTFVSEPGPESVPEAVLKAGLVKGVDENGGDAGGEVGVGSGEGVPAEKGVEKEAVVAQEEKEGADVGVVGLASAGEEIVPVEEAAPGGAETGEEGGRKGVMERTLGAAALGIAAAAGAVGGVVAGVTHMGQRALGQGSAASATEPVPVEEAVKEEEEEVSAGAATGGGGGVDLVEGEGKGVVGAEHVTAGAASVAETVVPEVGEGSAVKEEKAPASVFAVAAEPVLLVHSEPPGVESFVEEARRRGESLEASESEREEIEMLAEGSRPIVAEDKPEIEERERQMVEAQEEELKLKEESHQQEEMEAVGKRGRGGVDEDEGGGKRALVDAGVGMGGVEGRKVGEAEEDTYEDALDTPSKSFFDAGNLIGEEKPKEKVGMIAQALAAVGEGAGAMLAKLGLGPGTLGGDDVSSGKEDEVASGRVEEVEGDKMDGAGSSTLAPPGSDVVERSDVEEAGNVWETASTNDLPAVTQEKGGEAVEEGGSTPAALASAAKAAGSNVVDPQDASTLPAAMQGATPAAAPTQQLPIGTKSEVTEAGLLATSDTRTGIFPLQTDASSMAVKEAQIIGGAPRKEAPTARVKKQGGGLFACLRVCVSAPKTEN